MVTGARIGRGEGSSKKSSESAAAQDALERLGYGYDGQPIDRSGGLDASIGATD